MKCVAVQVAGLCVWVWRLKLEVVSMLTSPMVPCRQGLNADGQLGDGTTTNRLTPTVVHFDGWWKAAAAGDYHSCGIRAAGSLWCWVRRALQTAEAGARPKPASLPVVHGWRQLDDA